MWKNILESNTEYMII